MTKIPGQSETNQPVSEKQITTPSAIQEQFILETVKPQSSRLNPTAKPFIPSYSTTPICRKLLNSSSYKKKYLTPLQIHTLNTKLSTPVSCFIRDTNGTISKTSITFTTKAFLEFFYSRLPKGSSIQLAGGQARSLFIGNKNTGELDIRITLPPDKSIENKEVYHQITNEFLTLVYSDSGIPIRNLYSLLKVNSCLEANPNLKVKSILIQLGKEPDPMLEVFITPPQYKHKNL